MSESIFASTSGAAFLIKLVSDKSVDVVVAGQPAPLIANMTPEAQKLVKLLNSIPIIPPGSSRSRSLRWRKCLPPAI
jgi:hypothetical protein